MANDCVVTKRKKSVDNNTFERLGCIRLTLKAYNGVSKLSLGVSCKAVIIGDGQFTNSSGTENKGKETTGNTLYFKEVTTGDICYVYNKYNITLFNGDDAKGFLKTNEKLDLAYCSKLTQIKWGNSNSPYFDINDFSKKTSLNALTIFRSFSNNNLYGEIETVVENMLSNGRTTGSVKFGVSGNNIKFHGVKSTTGIGGEWCIVQFNSATSVTVYKGETTSGQVLATYNGTTWTYSS